MYNINIQLVRKKINFLFFSEALALIRKQCNVFVEFILEVILIECENNSNAE